MSAAAKSCPQTHRLLHAVAHVHDALFRDDLERHELVRALASPALGTPPCICRWVARRTWLLLASLRDRDWLGPESVGSELREVLIFVLHCEPREVLFKLAKRRHEPPRVLRAPGRPPGRPASPFRVTTPALASRAAPFASGLDDLAHPGRAHARGPIARSSPRRPVAMAASKAARGAFILFEGVDRCGKTTQSTLRGARSARASGPSCGGTPTARPGWAS